MAKDAKQECFVYDIEIKRHHKEDGKHSVYLMVLISLLLVAGVSSST